jgi:hypothetical protein
VTEGFRTALAMSDRESAAFFAAWQEAVPVMALRRAETTLPPTILGRDSLPRSPATAARARRTLATQIVRAGLPRAVYVDKAAFGLLNDVILPAANEALAEAVSAWSASTLIAVAELLNDAHADRARRAGELALALTAPWGERWQAVALKQPEPALATRPLELLLEMVLARDSAGSLNADVVDIAEVTDVAEQALGISLDLAAIRSRLHGLEVILDDNGEFVITGVLPEHNDTAIDMGSYVRADPGQASPGAVRRRANRVSCRPAVAAGRFHAAGKHGRRRNC